MFAKIENCCNLLLVTRRLVAVLIWCLCLTLPILATPGDLDLTFGTGGKVTTPIGASEDVISAVAIQTDGKIVVGGYFENTSSRDFVLARYNTDGSLDVTFGTGGIVTTSIGGISDVITDIAIQADGKIVAVGSSYNGFNNDIAVARYKINGTLDLTFDADGKVTTPIGTGDDAANAVTISGTNIIVAGFTENASQRDFAVVRYKPDGSLDGGFGSGGIVTTSVSIFTNDEARDVAIQTDGKIVAAGYTENPTVLDWDFAVVRYNVNGSLDTSFGTAGKVISAIGTSDDFADSVAIQPDGFIVAAGYSLIGSSDQFALIRYKPDGALDVAFGTGGKVTTPVGISGGLGRAVAIQSDGKIVLAGASGNGANSDFTLVRYNANGSLDTGFGIGGKVITPIGTSNDDAFDIAIQMDGKIVLAGLSSNGTNNDFAVARYLAAPPNGFLYILNDNTVGNSIYGFSVNETTGSLTALAGFPVATGGTGSGATVAEQITTDPINNRLFVINDGSDTVSAYSVNATNGMLTALPFSPISLGAGQWATIAVHSSGSPLVVGRIDPPTVVKSFKIAATTAIEAVGSPYVVVGDTDPFSSAFSRDGNFFYTGGGGVQFVGYSVAPASGVLTVLAGSPYFSGSGAAGFATDSQGRLFLADFDTGALRVFKTTGGEPGAATSNPFFSGLTGPVDGLLHPNEQFYFVADRDSFNNSVGSYQIGGVGTATTLSPVAGSPFASGGSFTTALATNQTGTFLFAANGFSRNLTTYGINSSTGVLTSIGVQPPDTLGMAGLLTGIGYYSQTFAPTAASVTVGGQVTTSSGRGISRARVMLTDGNGETRTAITNSFGCFQFEDVRAGETYIVEIRHKRYQFAPQVITVADEITDLNFVGFN